MFQKQKPLEKLTQEEFIVSEKAKEQFKETISFQNAKNEVEEKALSDGYARYKVEIFNRDYSKFERQMKY